MKTKLLTACAVWIVFAASLAPAQSAPVPDPQQELNALVTRIQTKLRAGQKTAAELSPELVAFDSLRDKYADRQPAAAAKIALMHYSLCRDVLKDAAKAMELRTLLTTKYAPHIAGTRIAQELEMEKQMKERMDQRRANQSAVVGKPAPELDFIWSTDPAVRKLADLRGKVVVLDFWATWCGPCIATFPQIRELVAHYQGADVAVVGVTSLQGYVMGLEPGRIDTRGNPEKEFALMPEFIKAKNITWTVAFSEQRVFNPDYAVMGIPHMAIIAPDGTVRHNGLHPGMPKSEKLAMIDALLKEFGRAAAAAGKTEE